MHVRLAADGIKVLAMKDRSFLYALKAFLEYGKVGEKELISVPECKNSFIFFF